jgi:hypothetical protein
LLVGAVVTAALALGLGIIIGHFAITKTTSNTSSKYDRLTQQADQQNYKTFVNSIQATNIEANLE